MTDQFKIDKSIALEETQIIQKVIEEAHIEREAPEEAYVPKKLLDLSKLCTHGKKMRSK